MSRAACITALLLALGSAQADEALMEHYSGSAVVVPLDDAAPRAVMLDNGVWLVCWQVVGVDGYECRPMSGAGRLCTFPGGRFFCGGPNENAQPRATTKPARKIPA